MKRIPLYSGLFLVLILGIANANTIIRWDEAQKYYGQTVTVEGKIVGTYNSGKACFLNFHPDYKKYFTVVIFNSAFSRFPSNPEDFYYGKEVQVTGKIKQYRGKPEIILNDPSQIRVIAGSASNEDTPEIVSWMDAQKYYGKIVTIEGTVVATYNSGKACFLNFHRNWKRYFTVVIFASNFDKFHPSPEIKFKDRKIEVTGLVKKYKGKPEIIVNSPTQIKILPTY